MSWVTDLPDLNYLSHEEKDALILGLWAQVQALAVATTRWLAPPPRRARAGGAAVPCWRL